MSNERGYFMPSRKKRVSTELKLEIVERYQKGDVSAQGLAEQYHVSKSDVFKWNAAYSEHGVAGLCTTHGTYSGDFKIAVVEYMHNHGVSIRQTAAHFNIPTWTTISKWERIYYEEGKEALHEERRGRSRKMGIRKSQNKEKNIEKNEDLLAEVQRLRMENEYLKKLNALIQEREKSEKSIK